MPIKTNYERVSIAVKSQRTLDLVYKIKMYLESIHEKCTVYNFFLICDGECIDDYNSLEEYTTINYSIDYYSDNQAYGIDFYKRHCIGFPNDELHVFGIINFELPKFYTYNGHQICDLRFQKMINIANEYQTFEAHPFSIIFQIPESATQDEFKRLLKEWVEIGSEFYEECSDIENIDGYISYLVEPNYTIDLKDFIKVIELYNQLIEYIKIFKGRLISVQPLFISHSFTQDVVLKIEKNNVGIYTTDSFFYPVLN